MTLSQKNLAAPPSPPTMVMWKSYLQHSGFAFLAYLAVTLFIFRHRWIDSHLSTQYSMPGIDTDGTMWSIWAINFKGGAAFINDLWSYPYGYDFYGVPFNNLLDSSKILFLNLLGGQWQYLILITNLSAILAYPFAAITMFIFAHYITRDFRASFIAGIIFGFSHYFILLGRGSLSNNHFELIPLFYLAICYAIENNSRIVLALGATIMAIQFGINAYWGFFAGLFTPIVFALYGEMSFKARAIQFCYFFAFSIFAIGLINYELVITQFLISKSSLATIARPPTLLINELIPAISIFSPPSSSWMYTWSNSNESFFLGYTALILVTFACCVGDVSRNRKFLKLYLFIKQ